MIYLFGQILVWIIVATGAGIFIGWLTWGKRLSHFKSQYHKLEEKIALNEKAEKEKTILQQDLAKEKLHNSNLDKELTALKEKHSKEEAAKDSSAKNKVTELKNSNDNNKKTSDNRFKPKAIKISNNASDDLTQIKGITAHMLESLNEIGIFQFSQIANLSDNNIQWLENHLNHDGQISREGWVEQAKRLMKNK